MPSDVIAVKDAAPVASLNRPLPPEKVYVPASVVGDVRAPSELATSWSPLAAVRRRSPHLWAAAINANTSVS